VKKRVKVQTKKQIPELLEVEPFGVTAAPDNSRPVMLFRVKGGEQVLPVWLSAIDAGIAITQHHVSQVGVSPHDLALKVFQALKLKLEQCIFVEVKGHHQFVELRFSGEKAPGPIQARADQAVSFSLQSRARFFATRACIRDSRVMDAQMQGAIRDQKLKAEAGRHRLPYLN
jgi:bifunctional DNase/RNase